MVRIYVRKFGKMGSTHLGGIRLSAVVTNSGWKVTPRDETIGLSKPVSEVSVVARRPK